MPKISSDTFYMPEGGMFYTDDDHGSGMYGTDDTIFFMTDDALKVYICNSEVERCSYN